MEVLSQEEIDDLNKVIQETLKPEDFEKFRKLYRQRENLKRQKFNVDVDRSPYKATEVLSQDELDQLLAAINEGMQEKDEDEEVRGRFDTRRIKIYDFKRPDKFSKEQIRTISMMHETFARLTTTSLSAQLRSMAHVHVASVDQLTYEEFIRSIPTPTTLGIINMDPLKGNAIFEIDPAITFSIIDRLLGGTGEGTKCQHELTNIEMSIMEGILVRMLGNLREAWTQVIDLRPRLGQIDTNPQFAQIVHPTDMVVLVTFEAKLGDVEGMINFCIPHSTIEDIMCKLETQYWFSGIGRHWKPQSLQLKNFKDISVDIKAEIGKVSMPLSDVKKLKAGYVLNLNPNALLKVNDTVIGNYEVIDGNIKITKITNYNERNYMDQKENVSYELDDLDKVNVQIICELGRTTQTLEQIKSFGEGTILELNKLAGEPVDIFANNVLIAKGEVVVIDENFGVRMLEVSYEDKICEEEQSPVF